MLLPINAAGELRVTHRAPDWLIISLILLLALVVRLAAYAISPGLMHPDEIFQYAEAAHRLVFGQGIVPWEYRYGLRSWLFPGILAGVMELARPIGSGPIVQNTAIAFALSLASLPNIAICFCWARRAAGLSGGLAAAVLAASWSECVLIAVHPLLDCVAMDAFIPGLFLLERSRLERNRRQHFFSGVLFGLAAVFRPHYAPVIAWCWVRCCYSDYRRSVLPLAAGFALPLLASGALDWITLGSPFLSLIRYVTFNGGGGADNWGTAPWYTYVKDIVSVCGSFFPLILICLCLGAWRCWLPLETATAFIVVLSAVPHKEMRFILPVLPLLFTVAGAGSARLLQLALAMSKIMLPQLTPRSPPTRAAGMFLVAAWLVICAVHAHAKRPCALWARGRATITLMHEAALDETACGLAIVPPSRGGSWMLGGYTHLRLGMTLTVFVPKDPPGVITGFSYAIAEPGLDLRPWRLILRRCMSGLSGGADGRCLWRNPAACNGPAMVPEITLPDPAFLAYLPLRRLPL